MLLAPACICCSTPNPLQGSAHLVLVCCVPQGNSTPASRIPTYKSPTKQPKNQATSQQQPQVQAQAQPSQQQQQQLMSIKQSRIPQPITATRKSLPDAEQAGSSPDQLILQAERDRRSSNSSTGGATVTDSASSAQGNSTTEGETKPQGVAASRIAAFQRSTAAAAASSSAGSGGARGGGGLVAAAAAAFGGAKPAGGVTHVRSASTGGVAPPPAPSAAAAALRSAPVEAFVPLDLDSDEDDEMQLVRPLAQQHVQPKVEQQEVPVAPRPLERLSHSGSSNGSLAGRGSAGRLPSRSLLQLEPSRCVLVV